MLAALTNAEGHPERWTLLRLIAASMPFGGDLDSWSLPNDKDVTAKRRQIWHHWKVASMWMVRRIYEDASL